MVELFGYDGRDVCGEGIEAAARRKSSRVKPVISLHRCFMIRRKWYTMIRVCHA